MKEHGPPKIKTHPADYSWFPADLNVLSTDTLCDLPDANERETRRHREKLHDCYTPNRFSFHALLPRKIKDKRNTKKKEFTIDYRFLEAKEEVASRYKLVSSDSKYFVF